MNQYVGIFTSIATALAALATVFSSSIQEYAAAHPAVGGIVAAVAVIVAAFSKSIGGGEQK